MAKQFRKLDQLMMSLGDKEATYDAGPAAWTLGAAFQLFEFGECFVAVGRCHRYGPRDGARIPICERGRRSCGRMCVCLRGTTAAAQPPGRVRGAGAGESVGDRPGWSLVAYRHKIIPVAATVQCPSIGVQEKASGEQYKYTGIKADTFRAVP